MYTGQSSGFYSQSYLSLSVQRLMHNVQTVHLHLPLAFKAMQHVLGMALLVYHLIRYLVRDRTRCNLDPDFIYEPRHCMV